jgi:DNA-binding NtrC family response regulator
MKILIADDQYEWLEPLSEICRKAGHEVVGVRDGEDVLKMPETTLRSFHAALLDYKMPTTGLEAGKHIKKYSPDTLYMMLTAHEDTFTVEKAVEAIKEGFFDYIGKSGDYKGAMVRFLQHAEERAKINLRKQQQGKSVYTLDDIVGECQQMCGLKKLLQTVAPTDTRVLILGESGTGKELAAGALHSLSNQRNGNYVRINCAAIPETLLESELFGHEKGAFTGALRQKPGRVEDADGGTVFLDEIADMSRPLQAKLLRFLEDGTFTRVGGNQELCVKVRLISATNRNIVEAMQKDDFREDLFHRLNVVQMRLPPLRERGGDVALLAEHFLKKFAAAMGKGVEGISTAAIDKLIAHHWPGNVRELRNAIERALVLEDGKHIQPQNLPDFQSEHLPHKRAVHSSAGANKETSEAESSANPRGTTDLSCFWMGLQKNNFKLWQITDLETVRKQTITALKQSTLIEEFREPQDGAAANEEASGVDQHMAEVSDKQELQNQTDNKLGSPREQKGKAARRLEGFVPPSPFTVRYVDPVSGEIQERKIAFESNYHPEPNYVKRLYQQGAGSNIVNHIPIMVSAVCRFAKETPGIKTLRAAFQAMTETVINPGVASAVTGTATLITGEQNLWEKESKGNDGAFRDLSYKFKHDHADIHERIQKHFPDYQPSVRYMCAYK